MIALRRIARMHHRRDAAPGLPHGGKGGTLLLERRAVGAFLVRQASDVLTKEPRRPRQARDAPPAGAAVRARTAVAHCRATAGGFPLAGGIRGCIAFVRRVWRVERERRSVDVRPLIGVLR